MNKFKFLILLFYYDRPKIVLNALRSITELSYDNYEIAFIDDGSINKGEEVIRKNFPNLIKKIKFYYINSSVENKIENGGSIFGKYANDAIKESDSDIGIMLCDDDALTSDYLTNLNLFYNRNTDISYCYSNILFYNPKIESYKNYHFNSEQRGFLNDENTPINPCRKVDMSQVSWRLSINKDHNIWFPYPQTMDLDLSLFTLLYNKLGNCVPTNFYGEIKGVFDDQLGNRDLTGYLNNDRLMTYKVKDAPDINNIWEISRDVYKIQQKEFEWKEFLGYVIYNNKMDNALEIGCYNLGGTYGLCKLFNNVISIDIEKRENWDEFKKKHDNWEYLVGDSQLDEIIKNIKEKNIKFDLIFIDGDHTYDGVKKDYELYKDLLKDDGIIVFHDIIDSELHKEYSCNVSKFWNEIKQTSHHIEILMLGNQNIINSFVPYSYKNQIVAENKDWGGIGILNNNRTGTIISV